MNRVKVYNVEGICVDSLTKTQTKGGYNRWKSPITKPFGMLVRFLNSKGFYLKRQLQEVKTVRRISKLSRMSAAIKGVLVP